MILQLDCKSGVLLSSVLQLSSTKSSTLTNSFCNLFRNYGYFRLQVLFTYIVPEEINITTLASIVLVLLVHKLVSGYNRRQQCRKKYQVLHGTNCSVEYSLCRQYFIFSILAPFEGIFKSLVLSLSDTFEFSYLFKNTKTLLPYSVKCTLIYLYNKYNSFYNKCCHHHPYFLLKIRLLLVAFLAINFYPLYGSICYYDDDGGNNAAQW